MKILIFLQIFGALCLYLSAWVGKKNLRKNPSFRQTLYINNRIYPFYVAGFFLYLTGFLLNLILFSDFAQKPLLFLLPSWVTLLSALIFFGLFVLFALPPIYYMGLRAYHTQKYRIFNPFQPMELVISGPFRHCRHPMAIGIYSLYLGCFFLYPSPYSLISVFLGFIPAHLYFLIQYEEKELELRFGQQYLRYKAKTPFIFPRKIFDKKLLLQDSKLL